MRFPLAAAITALHALTSTPIYSILGNTLDCAPCAVHLNVPNAISDTFVPFATSLSQRLFGWPVPIKSPDPPEWLAPSKTVFYSHQWYDASAPLAMLLASPVWSPTLPDSPPMPGHALINQGGFPVNDEAGPMSEPYIDWNAFGHYLALAHDLAVRLSDEVGTVSTAVIHSNVFGTHLAPVFDLVLRLSEGTGAILAVVIDSDAFGPYFHLADAFVIHVKDVIGRASDAALRAWQAGVGGILSSKGMMDDRWSEVILWSTTPSATIRMKEVSAIALVIFMVSVGSSAFTQKKWNTRSNVLTKDVEEISYNAFEVSVDEHACISEPAVKCSIDPAMVRLPPAKEHELALAPEDVPLPEGDDFSLIFGENDSELTVTEQNGPCNVKFAEVVPASLEPSILIAGAINPAYIPLPEDDDSWLISPDDEHSVEEKKEAGSLNGTKAINVPILASVTADADIEPANVPLPESADDDLLERADEGQAMVPESSFGAVTIGIDPASIMLPEDDDDLLELPSEEQPVTAEVIIFNPADIPLPAEVGDELAEVSLQAATQEHDLNMEEDELALAPEDVPLPEGDDISLLFAEDDLTAEGEKNEECSSEGAKELNTDELSVLSSLAIEIDPANIPLPASSDNDLLVEVDEGWAIVPEISFSVVAIGIDPAGIQLPEDDGDLLEPTREEQSAEVKKIQFDPADIPLPAEVDDELAEVYLQAVNQEHDLSKELAFASGATDLYLELDVREVTRNGEAVSSTKAVDDERNYDDDGDELAMLYDDSEAAGEGHACFDQQASECALDPAMVPLPLAEENELVHTPEDDAASIPLPEDDGDWFAPPEDTNLATEVISTSETLAGGDAIDQEEGAPRTDYAGDVTAEDALALVFGVTERSLEVDVGEMLRVGDVVPPIVGVDGRVRAPEDEVEHAMLMPFPSVALNFSREIEAMMFADVEDDEEVTPDTHYRSATTAYMIPTRSPDPAEQDAFRGISIARSAPSLVVDDVGAEQSDAAGSDLESYELRPFGVLSTSSELLDKIPKGGSPLDGPALPGPSLLGESAPSVLDAQDSVPLVNSRKSRRERIGSLKRMYGSFISFT